MAGAGLTTQPLNASAPYRGWRQVFPGRRAHQRATMPTASIRHGLHKTSHGPKKIWSRVVVSCYQTDFPAPVP